MDNRTENTSAPNKIVNIIYFSFIVLFSGLIMWVFICISTKLNSIPRKQLPESLLYPVSFIFYPMFMHHIAGRCLKTIPLGKYTNQIGILIIFLLLLFLIMFIGTLDFTFIPGILLK